MSRLSISPVEHIISQPKKYNKIISIYNTNFLYKLGKTKIITLQNNILTFQTRVNNDGVNLLCSTDMCGDYECKFKLTCCSASKTTLFVHTGKKIIKLGELSSKEQTFEVTDIFSFYNYYGGEVYDPKKFLCITCGNPCLSVTITNIEIIPTKIYVSDRFGEFQKKTMNILICPSYYDWWNPSMETYIRNHIINFFKLRQDELSEYNIYLYDWYENIYNKSEHDIFLCLEPPSRHFRTNTVDKIREIVSYIPVSHRILYLYENPENRFYKWKINKNFLSLFGVVFTNLLSIVNGKHIFWIPPYQLSTNKKYNNDELFINTPYIRNNKLVLSPVTSTFPKRDNIVENFYNHLKQDFHIYGGNSVYKKYDSYKGILGGYTSFKFSKLTSMNKLSVDKTNIFKNFNFVLIIENIMTDGYISEKFTDSLFSLSIPIYFGSPNIDKIYPDLFKDGAINGSNYTVNELINLINNMSKDEIIRRQHTIIKFRNIAFATQDIDNEFCYILTQSFINMGIISGIKNVFGLAEINNKLNNKSQLLHIIELKS